MGLTPVKNTTVGLGILNIFDKNYNNHLNFSFKNHGDFENTPITEPGRNFSVFLQYKF